MSMYIYNHATYLFACLVCSQFLQTKNGLPEYVFGTRAASVRMAVSTAIASTLSQFLHPILTIVGVTFAALGVERALLEGGPFFGNAQVAQSRFCVTMCTL